MEEAIDDDVVKDQIDYNAKCTFDYQQRLASMYITSAPEKTLSNTSSNSMEFWGP